MSSTHFTMAAVVAIAIVSGATSIKSYAQQQELTPAQQVEQLQQAYAVQTDAIGACRAELGDVQRRYQAPVLAKLLQPRQAFVQAFELANPGKTLDETSKVIDKPQPSAKKD